MTDKIQIIFNVPIWGCYVIAICSIVSTILQWQTIELNKELIELKTIKRTLQNDLLREK